MKEELKTQILEQIKAGNNYCYSISRAINKRSTNVLNSLRALIADGLIEVQREDQTEGRKRVVYRIIKGE
jgi:DNA-binding PadR family transcriptional regulator